MIRELGRSWAATAAVAITLLAACGVGSAPSAPAPAAPTPTAPTPSVRVAHSIERVVAASAASRAPRQPELAAGYRAVLVDDHCTDRDLLAPLATDEALTILDRTYALPLAYVPGDLVPASEAGLDGVSGTKFVSSRVARDLRDMAAAWRDAALTITVESAYRSAASQAATFDDWVRRLGYAAGLERSARPGHSEHQLGTALDVTSPGWEGRVGDWAAQSVEGAWMAEHAWEYGFVMSYPADATAETCFGYEPWHYRWIGRDLAAEHRASGLTLRRFLERFAVGGER